MNVTQREAVFQEGYVEADGFRVRYVEGGQSTPAGAVVMVDGMTLGLKALRDALAQQYQVVDIELPGLGQSPVNTQSRTLQDLATTLAQTIAKVAPDKYTLIGTSFGANVALWHALQTPDSVEALILISPTTILPAGGPMAGSAEEMAERLLAHPENAQRLLAMDQAVFAQEVALIQRLKGTTHDQEAESKLGEIRCATLVVFGLDDQLVAPEAARVYKGKIPNSNHSIVYDAGHAIAAERPEALINAVADYVEYRETFIVGRQTGMLNP